MEAWLDGTEADRRGPPATPDPEVVDVKRLDHLPLGGAILRERAVQDTLDALRPPPQRNAVTGGECVAALVLLILPGAPALSRGAEPLANYDVEVIFQRPLDAAPFHDTRLGRALAALWTAGLERLYGAVISQAIRPDALALARLPTDTTSLEGYGADEQGADAEGPLVTFGDSRDHRPDRKPLLCGLTVPAAGSPVWGHGTEGHCSDSPAHRFHSTQLRHYLPDLGAPLLVADSKLFAGETMALAAAPRLRCVTLVPQTVTLRQEVVAAPEPGTRPLLWEQPGRRQGELEHERGAAVVRP